MPVNDYLGSIAQQYIDFDIQVTIQAAVGTNFQAAMIFINDTNAATNLLSGTAIGDISTLDASNFDTIAQSTLLSMVSEFFANNSISQVFVVVYDHTVSAFADITTQFNKYKNYAYFKLLFETTSDALIVLATDCDVHKFSQCWITTADTNCFDEGSDTSIAHLLRVAEVNPHLEFHETAANSALTQLGLSLAQLNISGFAVGNNLDYKNTNTILASGAAGVNLTATQVTALVDQNIGYWATVGNNTGFVAQFGGKTLKGDLCGAKWFTAFIEYMCSVLGATYLTDPTQNHFRNNDTYQGLLTILQNQVTPFITIGKISGFKITAPAFAALPDTGDSIIVPNAWIASYNDNVRKATVQGILVVTVS